MEPSFVIGQIISVFSLMISVVAAQFKEVKRILLGQIASNLSTALSYLFLGGMSGTWICIVAAVQAIVIYAMNGHGVAEKWRQVVMGMFALMYVIGTIIVFRGWEDVVPCVCAIFFLMAIMQKHGAKYRWYMICNSLLWVLYDMTTLALVNIIMHGMYLLSLIIAKLRLDNPTKKVKFEMDDEEISL